MTDTDITALIEQLRTEWSVRKSSPHDYDDEITDMMAAAADALEALQAKIDQLIEWNSRGAAELTQAEIRAEKAEQRVAELEARQ